MPRVSRKPTHAGSWYDASGNALAKEIDSWMNDASIVQGGHAQAIIAPHAGYRYCGHVMAYAYKHINPEQVSRVFLLGPSHHKFTRRCMLSQTTAYDTPLGSMAIDQGVYDELRATGAFDTMDVDTDEAEHSLELHTPYIQRTMAGRPFTLVPVMVGSLTPETEAEYGAIFGPYLDDPRNCFVVSSDFCHWGSRFSYTFYDKQQGPIWKSIQWLDEQGMQAIETGRPEPFTEYLSQFHNTICGRHPIGVLLNMLQHCQRSFDVKFQHYDQSSHCNTQADSSVSYAAATVVARGQ